MSPAHIYLPCTLDLGGQVMSTIDFGYKFCSGPPEMSKPNKRLVSCSVLHAGCMFMTAQN